MLVFRPDANYIRYRILQVYQLCSSVSSASPSISPSCEQARRGCTVTLTGRRQRLLRGELPVTR